MTQSGVNTFLNPLSQKQIEGWFYKSETNNPLQGYSRQRSALGLLSGEYGAYYYQRQTGDINTLDTTANAEKMINLFNSETEQGKQYASTLKGLTADTAKYTNATEKYLAQVAQTGGKASMEGRNTYMSQIAGTYKSKGIFGSGIDPFNTGTNSNIIKSFNELKNADPAKMKEFAQNIGLTNKNMGEYLAKVEQGKASMQGFTWHLTKAKLAQLGLNAAAMAGNMILATVVSMTVSTVFSAIHAQINSAKDLAEQTRKLTEDFNTQSESLKDNISTIKELRESLDSLTQSTSENYDTRTKLLDIQKEILSTYGEEAKGIDLVNGSLDEQIEKLYEIERKKATKTSHEAKQGYEKQQKQVEKEYNTWWKSNDYKIEFNSKGQTTVKILDVLEEAQDAIKKSNPEWSDKFYVNSSGFYLDTVTRREAIDIYNSLMDYLEKSYKENDDFIKLVQQNLSDKIGKINTEDYQNFETTIKDYAETYIKSNEQLQKYYYDIIFAEQRYTEAVASGDTAAQNAELAKLEELKNTINELKDVDQYIKDFYNDMYTGFETQIGKMNFKKIMQGKSGNFYTQVTEAIKQFPQWTDEEIKQLSEGNGSEEQLQAYETLTGVAEAYKLEVSDLIDVLVELGVVAGKPDDKAKANIKSYKEQSEQLDDFRTNIENIDSALKSMQNGEGLDFDTVDKLLDVYPELYKSIIKTAKGYKIEENALEQLRRKQIATKKAEIQEENKKSQAVIDGYNDEVQKYEDYLARLNSAKQQYKALSNGENSGLTQEQIKEYKQLIKDVTGYDYGQKGVEDLGAVIDARISRYQGYVKTTKSNIDDVNDSIEQSNFLIESLENPAEDFVELLNNAKSKVESIISSVKSLREEMVKFGRISPDTLLSFAEQVPDWYKYVNQDESGKYTFDLNNDAMVDMIKNSSGYKTAVNRINAKSSDSTYEMKEMEANLDALAKSWGYAKTDGESYEEFVIRMQRQIAKSRNRNQETAKTLGQWSDKYKQLSNSAKDQANELSQLEEIILSIIEACQSDDAVVKFTSTIENLDFKKSMDEIGAKAQLEEQKTQVEELKQGIIDTYGENAFNIDGTINTEIVTNNETITEYRNQVKDVYDEQKTQLEKQYSDALEKAQREYDLGNITAAELQARKRQLNEQYYGSGSTLGKSDDGKDTYKENAEQISDMNKDIFDEINTENQRLKTYQEQSAKDYWEAYKKNAEIYLKDMPKEYKDAMDEYHTTGVKEMYDEELKILENNKSLGLVTEAQYWTQREALYKKYLKDETALHEDATAEEIALRTEAITSMFEREKTLLERNYENGAISASDYLNKLKKLWEKFYKDKKELAEEDYETQKNILDATKNSVSEQIEALEAYNEQLVEPYQSEIDALEEVKDKYDDVMSEKIKALEKQKEAIEKSNEKQEKENELLEKKNALEKASIKNRLVYTGGGNWEARRDEDEYQSALKDYEDANDENGTEAIEKAIEKLEEEQEKVDESIDKQVKSLNNTMSEVQQPIEDLVSILNRIIDDTHNIDPKFIADILSTDAGTDAYTKFIEQISKNEAITSKYGQSLYSKKLSNDEILDIVQTVADEKNMSLYDYAKSIGLGDLTGLKEQSDDNTTAVSADTQATMDNTDAEKSNTQALNDLTKAVGGDVTATEENTAKGDFLSNFESYMKSEYGVGNVDLTKRPMVPGEDGSVETVLSGWDFLWQGDEENGKYVAVTYTPILPDGTVLNDNDLQWYIDKALKGSDDILSADKNGLGMVLKVEDFDFNDADVKSIDEFLSGKISQDELTENVKAQFDSTTKWGEALHDIQEKWLTIKGVFDLSEPAKEEEEVKKELNELTKSIKANTQQTKAETKATTANATSTTESGLTYVAATQAQAVATDRDGNPNQAGAKVPVAAALPKGFKATKYSDWKKKHTTDEWIPEGRKSKYSGMTMEEYYKSVNSEESKTIPKNVENLGNAIMSLAEISLDDIENADTKALFSSLLSGVYTAQANMGIGTEITSNGQMIEPNVINNAPVINTTINVEGSADKQTIAQLENAVNTQITAAFDTFASKYSAANTQKTYSRK